jgi:hypothetical protein
LLRKNPEMVQQWVGQNAAMMASVFTAIVAVVGSLIGARYGANAAIRAQQVAQDSIDKREREARILREQRVRHIFATRAEMLGANATVFWLGYDPETYQIVRQGVARQCELLETLYENVDFALNLEPEQLRLVGATTVHTRLGLEASAHIFEEFQLGLKAEAELQILFGKALVKSFAQCIVNTNDLLRALGRQTVLLPDELEPNV